MGFINLPTLAQTFLTRTQENPQAVLYRNLSKNPALNDHSITFQEFFNKAQNYSLGLRNLQARRLDKFAILSQSRAEWMMADIAIQGVEGISVPIDPELSKKEILEILIDSKPRFVFSDHNQHCSQFVEWMNQVPSIEKIIFFDSDSMAKLSRELLLDRTHNILSALALEELGRRENDRSVFEVTLRKISPDAPFTICYTSGTTGHPKAVTITQGALAHVIQSCVERIEKSISSNSEVTFCILPYAHIFGRVEAYTPFVCGWTETFTDSKHHFVEHFVNAAPSIFFSVPQVLEKFVSAAHAQVKTLSRTQSLVLSAAKLTGQSARFLGLGKNLKLIIVGGASLDSNTKTFFKDHSISVIEGYGLTETSGPITLESPDQSGLNQVGMPLNGVEIQITEDHEIRVKSPSLSKDLNLNDGWFYTGDLGQIDSHGALRITGRKKDLLILKTGRHVSPLKIEERLQAIPWIESAIVVGDGRPSLTALITLNKTKVKEIAEEHQMISSSFEDLCRQPVIITLVKKAVQAANDENAAFERIAQFSIIPRSFSQELGEMTPTLKLRRQVILKNHQAEINAMYNP